MARGIIKVSIVGNLGQDPEARSFPNGGMVTNISVATSESWTDRQTGQPQERTEWHRVTFNGRLAEIAQQYLRKGSKVYVEGSLRTRKWQDKQTGQDRYATEINAREMQMLDSRGDNQMGQGGYQAASPAAQPQGQNFGGYQQQPAQAQPVQQAAPAPQQAAPSGFDDFDDDIPF